MKIYKFTIAAVILCANFLTTNILAADLMEVYEKAFANDSTFKAAKASWLADREALAISKADLLPTLNAQGSFTRNRNEINVPIPDQSLISTISGYAPDLNPNNINGVFYTNTSSYLLQLTQPIFNFGSWAAVWGAQAVVKKAQATFMHAREDLLRRTAQAYFEVLKAKDILSYAKAKKASTERLFIQAKNKFDVGLTPITDLEDARKVYDIAISDEIGATNYLNDKFEQLNEITGVMYDKLAPVKNNFPLLSPKPASIDRWVKAAEQQNFELLAARYDAIIARENIKFQNAGHLPTLSAQGGYSNQLNSKQDLDAIAKRNETTSVSLQLTVPLFQGGKVAASARQADYQYQVKVSLQEQKHRAIVSKTRQTYLGILSNISKIQADLQAIKSAQSSLRSTQASYTVGTRTMADILTAQTQLYDAQKTFSEDEYTYIMQILDLKLLTGILDLADIQQVNSWLEKPLPTNEATAAKPIVKKELPRDDSKNKSKTSKIANKPTKNVNNNLTTTPVVNKTSTPNPVGVAEQTATETTTSTNNIISSGTTSNEPLNTGTINDSKGSNYSDAKNVTATVATTPKIEATVSSSNPIAVSAITTTDSANIKTIN